jgi:hypothetical protein
MERNMNNMNTSNPINTPNSPAISTVAGTPAPTTPPCGGDERVSGGIVEKPLPIRVREISELVNNTIDVLEGLEKLMKAKKIGNRFMRGEINFCLGNLYQIQMKLFDLYYDLGGR